MFTFWLLGVFPPLTIFCVTQQRFSDTAAGTPPATASCA